MKIRSDLIEALIYRIYSNRLISLSEFSISHSSIEFHEIDSTNRMARLDILSFACISAYQSISTVYFR